MPGPIHGAGQNPLTSAIVPAGGTLGSSREPASFSGGSQLVGQPTAQAVVPILTAVTATTSGSTTSITATVPAGVINNSVVLVVVLTSQGTSTITGLGTTGLVHAPGSPLLGALTNVTVNVLWKRASGVESGTYALTASAGIGFMMQTAGATFQTDKVMVGILIIAAAGMSLTQVLKMIEARFDKWRPDHHL